MPDTTALTRLRDLWEEHEAAELAANELALLRYRSNLLGADLRITNFGGGNTSSKISLPDPLSGNPTRVLAVKGSGGDLGSIAESGFALLDLDRLLQLKSLYRGEAHEDEMVGYYPLLAFGQNKVAASIDTPLHAFLPFAHVDHLHPDWAIALAASANGPRKLEEFNRRHGRHIVWIPWQRPGFELAMMIERAVRENPEADGLVLGSHGLFTWGVTQRDCYLNSIRTIDQMGEFIHQEESRRGPRFGGVASPPIEQRHQIASRILPTLRGLLSSNRRVIAHYTDAPDALAFAGSPWARELSRLGTSCPDHFIRTRICPLYVEWDAASGNVDTLNASIRRSVADYRTNYRAYYSTHASPDSPALRDDNPSAVVIPGVGLFGFGKNKKEARITTEFLTNAINVMAGANALEDSQAADVSFESFHNYVALPRREAFRIEYWALEEAKLQRMPPEAEFSRRIVMVVGGGSGIGREVALLLVRNGAHVVVADADVEAAAAVAIEARTAGDKEAAISVKADLADSAILADAIRAATLAFGGLDAIVNTAAIYPVAGSDGRLTEAQWAKTFLVNVTGNYLLAQQAESVFKDQQLPAAIVLTGSANAVVPKRGSEAYDTSKTAVNHLVGELAIGLAPLVRVNGIAPATVVAGSTMFPRDRVMQSLQKYGIEFSEADSTEDLRNKLAQFYAKRTLTQRPILPADCANAIVWLLSDKSAKTTGHIIPVDGGLPEAFLR